MPNNSISEKKGRWIQLSEDSLINQTIINELESFLQVASPKTMSRSLNYVFYMYLFHEKIHPSNFRHIAEDFYILHEFFDGISTSEIVKGE